MCNRNNFVYAGISGMYCFCGNNIKYPSLTTTTCTFGCRGDSTDYCGDTTGQYYSVYQGEKNA
jgi:hypothetical protein